MATQSDFTQSRIQLLYILKSRSELKREKKITHYLNEIKNCCENDYKLLVATRAIYEHIEHFSIESLWCANICRWINS